LSLASSTNLVVVLLAASALIGAIAALRFKVFVLAPIALLISLVSAAVLHMNDFGAGSGVAIVIACLVLNQAAYLIVHVYTPAFALLSNEAANSVPSPRREQDIYDDNGNQKPPPSATFDNNTGEDGLAGLIDDHNSSRILGVRNEPVGRPAKARGSDTSTDRCRQFEF